MIKGDCSNPGSGFINSVTEESEITNMSIILVMWFRNSRGVLSKDTRLLSTDVHVGYLYTLGLRC